MMQFYITTTNLQPNNIRWIFVLLLLLLLQHVVVFVDGADEIIIADPCYMCGDSSTDDDVVLANPTKLIPYLGEAAQTLDNPTCQEVYDFASQNISMSGDDTELCSIIKGQAAYCGCPGLSSQDPINACYLCPNGPNDVPGDPNYIVPNGMTCNEIYDYISFMPQTECNKLDRTNVLLNHNFICQCPDSTVDCSLCPDETIDMDNPNSVIPYFRIPNNDKPTCQEARDYVSIQLNVDKNECKLYQNNAGYCGCNTYDKDGNNPVDDEQPLNVCSLCPEMKNNPTTNLDYVTPDNDTCKDLQLFMSHMDETACQSTTAGLVQANAYVCGCPGVDEPICDFCLEGTVLKDPNASAGEGNLTCGEYELEVSTLPDNLCQSRDDVIDLSRDVCCVTSGGGGARGEDYFYYNYSYYFVFLITLSFSLLF